MESTRKTAKDNFFFFSLSDQWWQSTTAVNGQRSKAAINADVALMH
jgi:hypothetical protein